MRGRGKRNWDEWAKDLKKLQHVLAAIEMTLKMTKYVSKPKAMTSLLCGEKMQINSQWCRRIFLEPEIKTTNSLEDGLSNQVVCLKNGKWSELPDRSKNLSLHHRFIFMKLTYSSSIACVENGAFYIVLHAVKYKTLLKNQSKKDIVTSILLLNVSDIKQLGAMSKLSVSVWV